MTPARAGPDARRRLGHWLPADHDIVDAWCHGFAAKVEAKGRVKYHPVIEEFAELISGDPISASRAGQISQ